MVLNEVDKLVEELEKTELEVSMTFLTIRHGLCIAYRLQHIFKFIAYIPRLIYTYY